MVDLTPEERETIYNEEKAKREPQTKKKNKGCLYFLTATVIAFVILPLSFTVWPIYIWLGVWFLLRKRTKRPVIYSFLIFLVVLFTLAGYGQFIKDSEQKAELRQKQEKLIAEAKIPPSKRISDAKVLINKINLQSKDFAGQLTLLEKAKAELEKIKTNENLKDKTRLENKIVQMQTSIQKQQASQQKLEAKKQETADKIIRKAARQAFAKKYEDSLLDENINATVTTYGAGNTILKLQYVLVSKVWAHKLSQNAEFFDTLKSLGFKKFIISDGFNEEWYWTF